MPGAVSLVLGSGGARGLSFVGALRALDEAGVRVAHVVGSSMGSLVGAAWCSGTSADTLAGYAARASLWRMVRPDPLGAGLFSSAPVFRLAREIVRAPTFEALRVPLTVVCTDFQTGRRVDFSSGELLRPVVGSCLAAGAFTPVEFEGRHLIDGGYTDPVPASLAPAGSVVLVIDPSPDPEWPVDVPPRPSARNLLKVRRLAQHGLKSVDMLIWALSRERLASAARERDFVVVEPRLGAMAFTDYHRGAFAVEQGYEATRLVLDDLRARVCPSLIPSP